MLTRRVKAGIWFICAEVKASHEIVFILPVGMTYPAYTTFICSCFRIPEGLATVYEPLYPLKVECVSSSGSCDVV